MKIEKMKSKLYGAAFLSLLVIGMACSQANQQQNVAAQNASPKRSATPTATSESSQKMNITRSGSQTSNKGPAENFTGSVTVTQLFKENAPSRVSGGRVTFEPGARSNWHTHPLGQTLIVVAGAGYVQQEGETIQEMREGDVIWTPPGVKHWHGATPNSGVTHFAIQESLDGKNVNWLEKVSDEQYRR